MGIIRNEKFGTKEFYTAYALLIIGCLLFSVGNVMFVNPYRLAPGGTYGLANVLHHVFGWKISFTALAMDIPLLILGSWILGPRFGFKTILCTGLIFIFVFVLETTWGYAPIIVDENNNLDYILNVLVAGLIYGVAIGMIFKSGATSGGSDVISMILNKYTKLSLGNLTLIVDSCITITTLIAFKEIRLPIYSIALIFVESKIIDMIVDGVKDHKTILIISEKTDEIKDFILTDLERGGTFIKGEGFYNGTEKNVIYTVIRRKEFIELKNRIAEIDPFAFINVIESSEILGQGFKKLHSDF